MRTIFSVITVSVFALLVALSLPQMNALAQGKGETVERRIKFLKGRSSATVKGFIADRMTTHVYKVGARSGQTLSVQLASARKEVSICVIYPNGSSPDHGCGRSFKGILPSDGDYSILVDPKRENTSYSMTVTIR